MFTLGSVVNQGGVEYANPVVGAGLSFDRATIDGGVASVYLLGNVDSDECDGPRVKAQVSFAATQFGTVNSVNVFLNGAKI